MVSARVSFWLFPILIVLGFVVVGPADAKPRDLSAYTLRVHIFDTDFKMSAAGGFGSGTANLIDGDDVHAIDFTYECDTRFMKSPGNLAYVAKWKKPGKTLEIVGNEVGAEDHSGTCEFKVTLHDFIYEVRNNSLINVTQEQYKARNSVVVAKDVPVDSDPSHYPLRLYVLSMQWSPVAEGVQMGTGKGNLLTATGLSSVDFTTTCNAHFQATPSGRFYSGQWTQSGSVLTLLFATSGATPTWLACPIQTSVHTDIYVRNSAGVISAISQDDYRRTMLKASESQAQADAAPASAAAASPAVSADGGGSHTVNSTPATAAVVTSVNPGTRMSIESETSSSAPVSVVTGSINSGPSGTAASVQAAALYRKACDGGSAAGCGNLAILYANGNGVAKDNVQAVALSRKACDGGNVGACNNLGLFYANGTGVAQDYAQAVTLYRKACNAGVMTSCSNLGLMYSEGTGVTRDYAQAATFSRKACDAGVVASCGNLGVLYANGTGVDQDYGHAVLLYRKSCDGGDKVGCGNLGNMYMQGTGVAADGEMGVALLRKACDAGLAMSCGNLGIAYTEGKVIPKSYGQAAMLYLKACNAGYLGSCNNLGLLYAYGNGVPKDLAEATAQYRKACDGGMTDACVNLGNSYENGSGVARDHVQAVALFRKACDAGVALGCNNLGLALQK